LHPTGSGVLGWIVTSQIFIITLIKSAEQNGIDMNELLTSAIEEKFDDLAHTIINEHGCAKLVRMGLKAHCSK